MKNKHIILTVAFVILITTSNKSFAEQTLQFSQNVMPMNPVVVEQNNQKPNMQHPKHFSKEEMEAKKAEFEKRLQEQAKSFE